VRAHPDLGAQLVRKIRDDREHGASELARIALKCLARYSHELEASSETELRDGMLAFARRIQQVRPSMAPVRNLLNRWILLIRNQPAAGPEQLRKKAVCLADELRRDSMAAVHHCAQHAARLIGVNRTIMTHSYSSTVLEAFSALKPSVRAIVTESAPAGEGRDMATQLAGMGIPVCFITDAQIGLFVDKADVVLTGADTVARDGSLINKSGTQLLALAARQADVPFYTCFESFKYSECPPDEIELEEKEPSEIAPPRIPLVEAHNVYFDRTQAGLISAWVTEHGSFHDFGQVKWNIRRSRTNWPNL
jgi:translation initiation factor 2B subunit (eIF-2B alpha/beta/delta family)